MTVFGQNITRLMRERSLTLPKLAAEAQIDKGNLSRIIKGVAGYSAESLGRLAAALEVPIARLFSEEPNVEHVPFGLKKIPLIDKIHAGAFTGVFPELRDGEMQEFVYVSSEHSDATFAMRVTGDSMIPDFNPGDTLIIDPDVAPRPGRFVVAVNAAGEATLKRYASRGCDREGRDIFELIPSNSVYASLRSDQESLIIIGSVRERIVRLP